jgi:hypothetical protein
VSQALKGEDGQIVIAGYLEEEVDCWRREVEEAQLKGLEGVLEVRAVVGGVEIQSLLLDSEELVDGRMLSLRAVCLMVLPLR